MSRVGKKPILIPEDIQVKIEGKTAIIKGPKGELSKKIGPEIKIEIKENKIFLTLQVENKKNKALWGLTRNLLANMIKGVKEGFEKKLEIEGIGYKASLSGNDLELSLGFTHPIKIKAPEGIKFLVEKNTITVSGIDKELVGQTAAKIRKIKPPEPYKGKGVRYAGEVIKKKVGKKTVTTTV
jgi:large subunit ribosomal protein L6